MSNTGKVHTCPLCSLPLESIDELVELFDKESHNLFAFSLLHSKDIDQIIFGLNKFSYEVNDKYDGLLEHAKSGNFENFEIIFLSIEHSFIDVAQLNHIIYHILWNDQLDFLKKAFTNGLIQVFDIGNALETAIIDGKLEFVQFFFENGVTSMAGPRNQNDYLVAPGYLISLIVFKRNLVMLDLLLRNGYGQDLDKDEYFGEIVFDCMKNETSECFDLLVQYGFDVCANNCSEFIRLSTRNRVEYCRWFVEVGKCQHKKTWRRVKHMAFKRDFKDVYVYMSMLLDEELIATDKSGN